MCTRSVRLLQYHHPIVKTSSPSFVIVVTSLQSAGLTQRTPISEMVHADAQFNPAACYSLRNQHMANIKSQ